MSEPWENLSEKNLYLAFLGIKVSESFKCLLERIVFLFGIIMSPPSEFSE